MTDTDSRPPASTPSHRRHRRRRSSPARRFARSLGIDRGRPRAAVLVAALAVLVVAGLIALGGRPPSEGPTQGSPTPPLASSATVPPRATPSATLPSTSSLTPIVTPSPQPVGIVARRIRIDRLGIDLRIVEGDGLDAPLYKAAHYPGTGWPDGGSNIYIYAHAQTGMFLSLWDAKVGDQVVLDLVDGTTRVYIVTQVLPKVPYNALQYVAATPTEQLTLQTSTSYTPTAARFVVIAVPAPAASPSPSSGTAP